jgi:putative transposase
LAQRPATTWLTAGSSVPLQPALRHLDGAFRNLFEGRAKSPAFQQRRGEQSATYAKMAFSWDAARRTLNLAKMERPLDIRLDIRRSRSFAGGPTTVTVSRDTAGHRGTLLRVVPGGRGECRFAAV